jgi:ribosomal protein L44E
MKACNVERCMEHTKININMQTNVMASRLNAFYRSWSRFEHLVGTTTRLLASRKQAHVHCNPRQQNTPESDPIAFKKWVV